MSVTVRGYIEVDMLCKQPGKLRDGLGNTELQGMRFFLMTLGFFISRLQVFICGFMLSSPFVSRDVK